MGQMGKRNMAVLLLAVLLVGVFPEINAILGVPVVAFRTAEGNVLENTQLEPDIKVANHPADIVKGIDAQLEAAVKSLLGDIDKKK